MQAIDIIGAAVVGIALLRGFFLGLVREALSLGAIGGAVLVANLYAAPAGARLAALSDGGIPAWLAPWLAGAALGLLVIVAVGLVARWLRRGVRAAGLTGVDRLGGALLGVAEGVVVVCVAVLLGSSLLGRDHRSLSGSRSLEALERLEHLVAERGFELDGIDVAAPPRR